MKEISTTVIYRCDSCNKVLSDGKRVHKRHLSLAFSGYCGFVERDSLDNWKHVTLVETGIKQFCDIACLGAFVDLGEIVS